MWADAARAAVLNGWFLGAFFGTAVAGLAAAALAALSPGPSVSVVWLAVGSVVYVAGSILVTMACNVPRNDALAGLCPDTPDAEVAWRRYVAEWTSWNHVRTLASLAAAASFVLALVA